MTYGLAYFADSIDPGYMENCNLPEWIVRLRAMPLQRFAVLAPASVQNVTGEI